MKNIWVVILFSLVSISGWSQENPVCLSIFSVPSGVQIRLNSVLIGNTPLTKLSVKPGKYSIEAVARDAGIWNMRNVQQEVFIEGGGDTSITIQFPRLIKINSIPFHAKLLQDNHLVGLTPVVVDLKTYRGKDFTLEKTGYETTRFTLTDQSPPPFVMQPLDQTALKLERHSFTHDLFHSRFRTKFLFVTGTVVTHWMSFYFKNLADDNYDKYLTTANPALMNKYWDNTQKYDQLSEFTLGISYAFLGGLIYTVLWR